MSSAVGYRVKTQELASQAPQCSKIHARFVLRGQILAQTTNEFTAHPDGSAVKGFIRWPDAHRSAIVVAVVVSTPVVVLAAPIRVATTSRTARPVGHMRDVASLARPAASAATLASDMDALTVSKRAELDAIPVAIASRFCVAETLAVFAEKAVPASAFVSGRVALQAAAVPANPGGDAARTATLARR